MEVYVTRGTENEVRAYDGAVESLTSADSSGVGIRVLLEGPPGEGSRLGFAWAGSLDPTVVKAALSDARDNARYATPDPDVVLAEPDGVAAVEQDLWDDGVITTPMDEKIALALELERATRGADPRVRQVSSADYSDARVEVALASTTGIRSSTRRTTAFVSVDAIAGEGADSQTGTGFQRGPVPGCARSGRGHGRCRAAFHPVARGPEGQIGPVHRRLRPPRRLDPPVGRRLRPFGRGRGQGSLVLRRADR